MTAGSSDGGALSGSSSAGSGIAEAPPLLSRASSTELSKIATSLSMIRRSDRRERTVHYMHLDLLNVVPYPHLQYLTLYPLLLHLAQAYLAGPDGRLHRPHGKV